MDARYQDEITRDYFGVTNPDISMGGISETGEDFELKLKGALKALTPLPTEIARAAEKN